MGKPVYRLRVYYEGEIANIRSVGKNPRGSTYALESGTVRRAGPGHKLAEAAVQEVIDLLCPKQTRTPL